MSAKYARRWFWLALAVAALVVHAAQPTWNWPLLGTLPLIASLAQWELGGSA